MDEIKRAKNIILFIDELHTIVGAGAAEGRDGRLQHLQARALAAASCSASARRRSTSTASTSRRTPRSTAASSRSRSSRPRSRTRSRSCKGIRAQVRGPPQGRPSPTRRSNPPPSFPTATSPAASCRTRPSTSWTRRAPAPASRRLSRPPDIEALTKEIEEVCALKEKAISEQHFEEAAKFRDKEKQLRRQARAGHRGVEEGARGAARRRSTRTLMMQVVADWTGIPLSRMEKKESEKLLGLEAEIEKTVIGQEVAAGAIARALRRSRADLKDPRRPDRLVHVRRPDRRRQDRDRPSSSPRRCSATRTRSSRST